MKPLQLTMQGFLTYKNKTIINLENIHTNIIKIEGDIGKTTIFDAIYYALYGICLKNNIRTYHIEDYIQTYVSFKFKHLNDTYEITRYYQGEVILNYNNKLIKDKDYINSFIENILGINKDQFEYFYISLEKLLINKYYKKETITNIFNDNYIKYTQNKHHTELLISLKNTIDKVKKAHQINNIIKENKELLNKINNVNTKINKEKYIIEKYNKQKEKIKDITQEINILKEELQLKNNFNKIENEYYYMQKDLIHEQELYKEKENHYESLTIEINSQLKYIEKIPYLINEMNHLENIGKELINKKTSLHELSELYDMYKNEEDIHYEKMKNYSIKEKEYHQLFNEYVYLTKNHKLIEAGLLAKDLKENSPCPVCGSLHHPNIAYYNNNEKTLERLYTLTQIIKDKKEQLDLLYEDLYNQIKEKDKIYNKINELKIKLNINETLNKKTFILLLDEITKTQIQLNKQYKDIKDELDYCISQKNKVDKYKKELINKEKQLLLAKEDIEDKKQILEIIKNDLNHFYNDDLLNISKVKIQRYYHLNNYINRINKIKNNTRKMLLSHRLALNYYINRYNENNNIINNFKDYKEYLSYDISLIEKEYDSLNNILNHKDNIDDYINKIINYANTLINDFKFIYDSEILIYDKTLNTFMYFNSLSSHEYIYFSFVLYISIIHILDRNINMLFIDNINDNKLLSLINNKLLFMINCDINNDYVSINVNDKSSDLKIIA